MGSFNTIITIQACAIMKSKIKWLSFGPTCLCNCCLVCIITFKSTIFRSRFYSLWPVLTSHPLISPAYVIRLLPQDVRCKFSDWGYLWHIDIQVKRLYFKTHFICPSPNLCHFSHIIYSFCECALIHFMTLYGTSPLPK